MVILNTNTWLSRSSPDTSVMGICPNFMKPITFVLVAHSLRNYGGIIPFCVMKSLSAEANRKYSCLSSQSLGSTGTRARPSHFSFNSPRFCSHPLCSPKRFNCALLLMSTKGHTVAGTIPAFNTPAINMSTLCLSTTTRR